MNELQEAVILATKAINNTDTVNKRLIMLFITCITIVSISFASVIMYLSYQMYDYDFTNVNENFNENINQNEGE